MIIWKKFKILNCEKWNEKWNIFFNKLIDYYLLLYYKLHLIYAFNWILLQKLFTEII